VFGIVISCYDHWDYIENAIDSVINQTFTEWELFVYCDDLNWNKYIEIVKKYETEVKIHFHYDNENKGLARRANEGLHAINELGIEYFMYLGADDWYHKNYLYNLRCHLAMKDWPLWMYGNFHTIDKCGRINGYKIGYNKKKLKKYNNVPCSSVVVKAGVLNSYKFNERVRFEDWEMWLLLSSIQEPEYCSCEYSYFHRIDTSVMNYDVNTKNKWQSLKRRFNRLNDKRRFRVK
jgi:glycosyltransferase involved in cell wall biosynthesis